jgi:hypothetical protein
MGPGLSTSCALQITPLACCRIDWRGAPSSSSQTPGVLRSWLDPHCLRVASLRSSAGLDCLLGGSHVPPPRNDYTLPGEARSRRTSAGRTSASGTSAGQSSARRTSARRGSSGRTSAGRTLAERITVRTILLSTASLSGSGYDAQTQSPERFNPVAECAARVDETLLIARLCLSTYTPGIIDSKLRTE